MSEDNVAMPARILDFAMRNQIEVAVSVPDGKGGVEVVAGTVQTIDQPRGEVVIRRKSDGHDTRYEWMNLASVDLSRCIWIGPLVADEVWPGNAKQYLVERMRLASLMRVENETTWCVGYITSVHSTNPTFTMHTWWDEVLKFDLNHCKVQHLQGVMSPTKAQPGKHYQLMRRAKLATTSPTCGDIAVIVPEDAEHREVYVQCDSVAHQGEYHHSQFVIGENEFSVTWRRTQPVTPVVLKFERNLKSADLELIQRIISATNHIGA